MHNTELIVHELTLLGACLANRKQAEDLFTQLYLQGYSFREEYKLIAQYLLEKITGAREGVVNVSDFLEKCNLKPEDLTILAKYGKRDLVPSYEFLVKNTSRIAKYAVLEKYQDKLQKDIMTLEDFDLLQSELSSVTVLEKQETLQDISLAWKQETDAYQAGEKVLFTTGIKPLDEMIVGIGQDDIIGIAGKGKSGKTHLMTQVALNILQQGGRVNIITAEMSSQEILQRLASHVVKRPEANTRVQGSQDAKTYWEAISKLTEQYKDQLVIRQESNFEKLYDYMRLRSTTDLDDIYFIDYIQLLSSNRKGLSSELERLDYMTSELVRFKNTFRKALFVVSQASEGSGFFFKGAQSVKNMLTVGVAIHRSQDLESEPGNFGSQETYQRVALDVMASRRTSGGIVYGKVAYPDPAFREKRYIPNDPSEQAKWNKLLSKQNYR